MQVAVILIIILICHFGNGVVRPGFGWFHQPQPLNETDEILSKPFVEHPSYITAQQCCKVGESLIRKVNSCTDASLRSNMLTKGLTLRQEIAKHLALEMSRCHQHQHLLQKCCRFRLKYVIALEMCNSKSIWERYKCRTNTRNKFGMK